jgi:hypothetical protein
MGRNPWCQGVASVFVLVCCAIANGPSGAQDAQGAKPILFLEALPPHLKDRIRLLKEDDPQAFGDLKQLWPRGQRIIVGFLGGNPALRKRVAAAASAWNGCGKVTLDFGQARPEDDPRVCTGGIDCDVRVAFGPVGNWSLVGTDAKNLSDPGKATLNLHKFDTDPPPEPYFTGFVLHEFGHVLGLQHEHQSPMGECGFNLPQIYQEAAKPPYNWTPQMVKENIIRPTYFSKTTLVPVEFDRESVMIYSLPKTFFLAGENSPCFVPFRFKLSAKDRQTIALFYPEEPKDTNPLKAVKP